MNFRNPIAATSGSQGASVPPPQLDRALLTEAQGAVLELMRRQVNPLVLDADPADPQGAQADQELRTAVAQVVGRRYPTLSHQGRQTLIDQTLDEIRGYGPLESLLRERHRYEEIQVNGPDRIYVIPVGGEPQRTTIRFRDDAHVRFVAARLLSSVRRRVSEAEPLIDASLPGGIRVNVALHPIAVDGTSLSIRLHHAHRSAADLVGNGTLTPESLMTLQTLVTAGVNILVTGGTGTGKTTLLNLLSSYIPETARIITVEDTVELQTREGNVIRLEVRPPNIEGKGEITIRHLVRNAMRMRPDWLLLGEMRGAEALDVMTAANSGHIVYSTIHANTGPEGLGKLAQLAAMSDEHLSESGLRYQVAGAFGAVVHITKHGPRRRVVQIAEVTGVDPVTQQITTRDIYSYRHGLLQPTGIRPERWVEALHLRGLPVPPEWMGEVE